MSGRGRGRVENQSRGRVHSHLSEKMFDETEVIISHGYLYRILQKMIRYDAMEFLDFKKNHVFS